jgi:hypothetical protein
MVSSPLSAQTPFPSAKTPEKKIFIYFYFYFFSPSERTEARPRGRGIFIFIFTHPRGWMLCPHRRILPSRKQRCTFAPQISRAADLPFHFLHVDATVRLSHRRPKSHRPRPLDNPGPIVVQMT